MSSCQICNLPPFLEKIPTLLKPVNINFKALREIYMLHNPIQLNNISHIFGNKVCFSNFSTHIYPGQRIAIIGNNGSGKSTLLKIISGLLEPTDGSIANIKDLNIGYVAQTINNYQNLSGSQRFNKALSQSLALNPSILCLDEPTNHLDQKNRQSLINMLNRYHGTLIIVTHDIELLNKCIQEIWHIEDSIIHCFARTYNEYVKKLQEKRANLNYQLKKLKRDKKQTHLDLMQEQKRAKNKKIYGMKKYGPDGCGLKAAANKKKNNTEIASGKNKIAIFQNKQNILNELQTIKLPEVIIPKFNLSSIKNYYGKNLVYIKDGSCGYNNTTVLHNIQLQISGGSRIAIKGDNASGKSTLVKAILNDPQVTKEGDWHVPAKSNIGYLDQHYSTLQQDLNALDVITNANPNWTTVEAKRHLNDFLFRKNEEICIPVSTLSGGEKCRLSLAQIAAISPNLIILDEITNNIDLTTREHIIQVLNAYPGAIIIISHDEDFLGRIKIDRDYLLK